MEYLPLIGIVIVIVGFALKWNSIGIVVIAMLATGLAGGMHILKICETIGNSFVANRNMASYLVILPVVGLLEKNGLKETAAKLIMKIKSATPGAVVIAYGCLRSLLAAFNVGLGGVAGFVRPVVYPMAVGAVEKTGSAVTENDDETIKGLASAMENITWFFGQVLFLGGSGMLLVKNTLDEQGYFVDPARAVAAEIPVLICTLVITFAYVIFMSGRIMKKYKTSEVKK